jgi:hypothetical protein
MEELFTQDLDFYIHIPKNYIQELYRNNEREFANLFFDKLPIIKPKVVRALLFLLRGIDVSIPTLLNHINNIPPFIYELQNFPAETLIILFNNKFPPIFNGKLFLYWSFQYFMRPEKLNVLCFVLDLCRLYSVDLDYDNKDKTLLQMAVEKYYLPAITILLSHGVNPNAVSISKLTPLQYLINNFNTLDLPNYFNMIQILISYGARVPDNIKINERVIVNVNGLSTNLAEEKVNNSDLRNKLQQVLIAGKKMKPTYCDINRNYFALNEIEDEYVTLFLTTTIHSKELKANRTKAIINADGELMQWPYFINQTVIPKFIEEKDDRPETAVIK